MSTRVLATDAAKDAASKLSALLSGAIATDVQQIHTQAATLSSPNEWDGPRAASFRGEWPQHETALNNANKAIDTIGQHAATVIAAIQAAGGGGSDSSAGPRHGGRQPE